MLCVECSERVFRCERVINVSRRPAPARFTAFAPRTWPCASSSVGVAPVKSRYKRKLYSCCAQKADEIGVRKRVIAKTR